MQKLKRMVFGAIAGLSVVTLTTVAAGALQSNPQDSPSGKLAALAVPPVCKRQSAANAAGQDIFLSTPDPVTYPNASGAWQDVACAGTTFRLGFGQRALVVGNFNAEADCNGTVPTNGQWCQTRALLNGAEGSPVAAEPSSFAFDSVAGGNFNWQAHSMGRAWEVRCGVENGCQYKFQVQTRMHDSTVTSMWLDEIATHIRVTVGAPAAL